MMTEDFAKWLIEQLAERGWSDSELARRAGVSHASISFAINGSRIGVKVAKGIARALKVPVEEVYQRAGLMPQSTKPYKSKETSDEELVRRFNALSLDQKYMLLAYLKQLEQQDKQKTG